MRIEARSTGPLKAERQDGGAAAGKIVPGLRSNDARKVVDKPDPLIEAEVVGQFAVEGTLDERFGELLEQSVLAEQVFRLLVVFEQFVE